MKTSNELRRLAELCRVRADFCHRGVYSEGMQASEALFLEEHILRPAAEALTEIATILQEVERLGAIVRALTKASADELEDHPPIAPRALTGGE